MPKFSGLPGGAAEFIHNAETEGADTVNGVNPRGPEASRVQVAVWVTREARAELNKLAAKLSYEQGVRVTAQDLYREAIDALITSARRRN